MRMLDVLGEKCYSVHGETTGVSYIISIQKRAYELVSHHGDIIWREDDESPLIRNRIYLI